MCVHTSFILPLNRDRLSRVEKVLSFAQGAAQLGQGNVLQLADALPCDAEIPAIVFQGLRLSTTETETLRNNFLLAVVEHCDQAVHFTAQIFIAQPFKRCLRVVSYAFAKLSRIIIRNRGVE